MDRQPSFSSFDNFRATNADSSAGYTALPDYQCVYMIVINDTAIDIQLRKVGNTDSFTLVAGGKIPLPTTINANEWEFKRTDSAATTINIGVVGYR